MTLVSLLCCQIGKIPLKSEVLTIFTKNWSSFQMFFVPLQANCIHLCVREAVLSGLTDPYLTKYPTCSGESEILLIMR